VIEENCDTQQSLHPSIDILFQSAATLHCGVLAIIMTGMGKDGLEGVQALHAKGAVIVAQDPESCVVSSMPNAIIANNLATYILTPDDITRLLKDWCGS
jgi:two-component system chemotaxis response regulator CheB